MAVVMDRELEEKLERVKRRSWWPVALLAQALGKPKMYIYRRIENDDFDIIQDGGIRKIISQSVVTFFENRYQKV